MGLRHQKHQQSCVFEATKIDSKNMLESTQFHNSKIIRKWVIWGSKVPKLVFFCQSTTAWPYTRHRDSPCRNKPRNLPGPMVPWSHGRNRPGAMAPWLTEKKITKFLGQIPLHKSKFLLGKSHWITTLVLLNLLKSSLFGWFPVKSQENAYACSCPAHAEDHTAGELVQVHINGG